MPSNYPAGVSDADFMCEIYDGARCAVCGRRLHEPKKSAYLFGPEWTNEKHWICDECVTDTVGCPACHRRFLDAQALADHEHEDH